MTSNAWTYFGVTYDSSKGTSNRIQFYVNGVAVKTSPSSSSFDKGGVPNVSTALFRLGMPGDGSSASFNGLMDEIEIYNRALSSDELGAIYARGATGKVPPSGIAPVILAQPANQAAPQGSSASFSVVASGSWPLSYQWYHGSSPITSGGTNATLTIPSVGLNDAGAYTVTVSNTVSSVGSATATLSIISPVTPPSGVVAWWRGESNFWDSIGANNGTAFNGAGFATGLAGQAMSFNGVNSYVEINGINSYVSATEMNLPATFTVEGWINPTTIDSPQYILAKNGSYDLMLDSSAVVLTVHTASGDIVYSTDYYVVEAGSWSHIAVTYDSAAGDNNQVLFFVDGVQVGGYEVSQSAVGAPVANASPLELGIFSDKVSDPFFGLIDELTIYNRVLTSGEINSIYLVRDSGKIVPSGVGPSIVAQPQGLSLGVADSAQLSVGATGSSLLFYQWYIGGQAIPGATNSSLGFQNLVLTNAGDYSVTVSNAYGTILSDTATLAVHRLTPTIVWANPATITYGVALDATQLNAQALFNSTNVPGTFSYTPNTGTVLNAGSGQTLSVTFTPTDGSTFASVTQTVNITVNQTSQTITFAPLAAATYGDAPITLTGSASSGLTVTYSSDNLAVATVSGNTVTIIGAGAAHITALQSGNGNYQAASPVIQLLTVNRAGSVVLNNLIQTYDGSPKSAAATTTPSGLSVLFTYNGSATVPVNAGSYAVVATINDANYGGTATGTLLITKAIASVSLGNLSQTYTGSGISASATTTPPGLPVFITYNGGGNRPVDVGSYTVSAFVNDSNYLGSATDSTLVINKSSQTITFGSLAAVSYGDAPLTLGATASSGLTVSYVSSDPTVATVSGSAVTILKAGQTVITASQSGNGNYLAATDVLQTLTVNKAVAAVTVTNLDQTYDGADKVVSIATVPANLTVTTTYDGETNHPVNAGSYAVVVTVDETNYSGMSSNTLVIDKAPQTITFGALSAATYGDAPISLAASTTSGLTVQYSSDNLSVATVSGNTLTIVGAGTANITASQTGNSNYLTASNVIRALTVNKAAATILAGNLTQTYNGSSKAISTTTTPSGLTVNVTYNGSATLPVGAGSYAVVATINDANYAGSTNATLVIGKATAPIVLGNLAQTFDGSAKAASAVTTPSGLTVTVTYNGGASLPVNAGSYTVAATIIDDNYAGTSSDTLVIGKASQTITFDALAAASYGQVITLGATASSGLTVSYASSDPTVASISSNVVTIVKVGSANITASQAGNSNYLAATSVVRSLSAGKAAATILVSNLSQTYSGRSKSVTVATTPSGLTVGVTYNGSASFPINAGSYTVAATITNASYAGSTNVTLVIGKSSQTVSFTVASPKFLGDAPFSLGGAASTDLALSYSSSNANVVTISGSTATITGAGITTLTATQSGNSNYLSASASATLAVGPVVGWGTNFTGQAVAPAGLNNVAMIAAGWYHNLALRTDGTVVAWGATSGGRCNVPVTVSNAISVSAGWWNGSALMPDGHVESWGIVETNVSASATNVVSISTGVGHTLALRADGHVVAWGLNGSNQCVVPSLSNVVAVAAGAYHSLAIKSDSTVAAWGSPTMTYWNVPVGLSNVVQVAGGSVHSVALKTDGTVVCWGNNDLGQCSVPVGLTNVVRVSAGVYHTIALKSDGTVVAWGANDARESIVPGGISGAVGISAGSSDTLALLSRDTTPLILGTGLPLLTDQSIILRVNDGVWQPQNGQWQVNGTNIPGATQPWYKASNVQVTGANNYTYVAQTASGSVTSAVASLTVSPASATVTITNLNYTYDGTPKSVNVTTVPAGLSVGITYNGSSTVPTSGGSYTVVATVTNPNYTGSATNTLVINRSAQTISFGTLAAATYGDSPISLGARASSGLTVQYSSDNLSVATVSGNTLTIIGAGSANITASQPGNGNYLAATNVVQALTVNKAIAPIVLGNLAQTYDGDTKSASVTTTPPALTVLVTYNGVANLPVNAGSYAVAVTIIDNNYAGAASNTLVIGKAPQTITFGALAAATYGDAPKTLGATTSSGLTVGYASSDATVASVSGNVATILKAGQTVITASQAGSSNYLAATSVPQTLTVQKASATVNLANLAQTFDGNGKVATVTTVPANLTVVVTYDGETNHPVNAGSYAVAATVNETNYSGTTSDTLVIGKASQTITFGALSQRFFEDSPFTLSATASSGLTVSYSSGNLEVANVSGNSVTLTGLGSAVITASQAGNSNYLAAPDVTQTQVVVATPPLITLQPVDQTNAQGTQVTFTTQASGTQPLVYQWFKGTNLIDGANATNLVLTNVTMLDAVGYSLVAANSGGSATTRVAQLIVTLPQGILAWRTLPTNYVSGQTFTVVIQVYLATNMVGYAVEDAPPAGWTVSALGDGVFDSRHGKVKFGPYYDSAPRTLAYQVTPPQGGLLDALFEGTVAFGSDSSAILGDSVLRAVSSQRHPADISPADGALTINEVVAYGSAWKLGNTWPVEPTDIPIDYVTRAAALWLGGEDYYVDTTVSSTPPLYWVNVPLSMRVRPMLGHSHLSKTSATRTVQPVEGGANITVTVTTAAGVRAWAAQEQLPANTQVSQISNDGVYDSATGLIKWGPFFDVTAQTLSYQAASVPAGILGLVSCDGSSSAVSGQATAQLTARQVAPDQLRVQFNVALPMSGTLESSTDLVHWSPVPATQYNADSTGMTITVSQTGNVFFRVRLN